MIYINSNIVVQNRPNTLSNCIHYNAASEVSDFIYIDMYSFMLYKLSMYSIWGCYSLASSTHGYEIALPYLHIGLYIGQPIWWRRHLAPNPYIYYTSSATASQPSCTSGKCWKQAKIFSLRNATDELKPNSSKHKKNIIFRSFGNGATYWLNAWHGSHLLSKSQQLTTVKNLLCSIRWK